MDNIDLEKILKNINDQLALREMEAGPVAPPEAERDPSATVSSFPQDPRPFKNMAATPASEDPGVQTDVAPESPAAVQALQELAMRDLNQTIAETPQEEYEFVGQTEPYDPTPKVPASTEELRSQVLADLDKDAGPETPAEGLESARAKVRNYVAQKRGLRGPTLEDLQAAQGRAGTKRFLANLNRATKDYLSGMSGTEQGTGLAEGLESEAKAEIQNIADQQALLDKQSAEERARAKEERAKAEEGRSAAEFEKQERLRDPSSPESIAARQVVEQTTGEEVPTNLSYQELQEMYNYYNLKEQVESRLAIARQKQETDVQKRDEKQQQKTEEQLRKDRIKYGKEMEKSGITDLVQAIIQADTLVGGIDGDKNIPGYGPAGTWNPARLAGGSKASEVRQAVAQIRNTILKARSGGAVTPSEATRLLEELGEGTIYSSEAGLRRGLRSVRDTLASKLQNYESAYGKDVIDSYEREGGIHTLDQFQKLGNFEYKPGSVREQDQTNLTDQQKQLELLKKEKEKRLQQKGQ